MIKSMTAFAREQGECTAGTLAIELRSVNHRYLDCSFKLPDQVRTLETPWREQLRNTLSRGKVECLVRWQGTSNSQRELQIDETQLQSLLQASERVRQQQPDCAMPTSLELLHWPGVLISTPEGEDELLGLARSLFSKAIETLQDNRAREGEKMAAVINDRLQLVSTEVERTRGLIPELLQRQEQRIRDRLDNIGGDLDPQRLEQELVLLAQKADVEEELDRLEAHVDEVGRVLKKGGPCGRRLDFLMQELNREANTLSSKSISSTSTQNAVELKVLIEQMREQIQNLE
jgi:uncharacterized protein (TIGR00255 family)